MWTRIQRGLRTRLHRLEQWWNSHHTVSVQRAQRLINLLRPVNIQNQLVRVGTQKSDGGYLLPDDFEGITACFSPGMGPVIEFDQQIAAKGIPVFICDASVEGPTEPIQNISFEKKFLGASSEGDVIGFNEWIEKYADSEGDLLLEMDIEGAEYKCLEALDEKHLKRFRTMVLEFHYLDHWFTEKHYDRFSALLSKLAKYHHVAHLHANCVGNMGRLSNGFSFPYLLEITYYRKDRVKNASSAPVVLPHPLDCDNVDNPVHTMSGTKVPENWYQ